MVAGGWVVKDQWQAGGGGDAIHGAKLQWQANLRPCAGIQDLTRHLHAHPPVLQSLEATACVWPNTCTSMKPDHSPGLPWVCHQGWWPQSSTLYSPCSPALCLRQGRPGGLGRGRAAQRTSQRC
jgi:hypothetical protein